MAASAFAAIDSKARAARINLAEHFDKLHQVQAKHNLDEVLLNFDPVRVKVATVVHSNVFKALMAACVFLSIGIVVHETDSRASGEAMVGWANPVLFILLGVYTLELALRLYVSGHKFFWTKLNVLDFVLVVVEFLTMIFESLVPNLPNVMVIRFFRLIRLARLSSVMMRFRPLYLILQGFFGAMQAIFFATILVFFVLSLWSIISVEFLHPIVQEMVAAGEFADCERCDHAYSSVMQSNLTFLQTMIVGDSWAVFVMPLIERDWRCLLVFGGVFITVQVGMLNLILAVIVDSASQARHDDEQRMIHEKNLAFKHAQSRFHKLCVHLDADRSGTLTEQELFEGLSNDPELSNLLTVMDITEREVGVLFSMMDVDKSGEVSYAEFTDMFHRFKTDDLRTHLMFLKHYVLEMTSKLDEDLGKSLKKIEARIHDRSSKSMKADYSSAPSPRVSVSSSADKKSGGVPRVAPPLDLNDTGLEPVPSGAAVASIGIAQQNAAQGQKLTAAKQHKERTAHVPPSQLVSWQGKSDDAQGSNCMACTCSEDGGAENSGCADAQRCHPVCLTAPIDSGSGAACGDRSFQKQCLATAGSSMRTEEI